MDAARKAAADEADRDRPGATVIVADDEESMRHFLRRSLGRHGFEVVAVESGDQAIERYEAQPFDVAVLDLKMPGADGIAVLERVRAADPEALVIIMTAHGTIRSAVDAMRLGAFDYITKPFEIDELLLLIERALSQRATLRENRALRQMVDNRRAYGGLIGQSREMRAVFQTIDLLRDSVATVLIHGESGTGKELLAHAIHLNSNRFNGEFVPLNCAAMPESLLESELFGHEAGAFTGASRAKKGLVARAERGTLFIDEVSEISPGAQLKLLRFLQERKYTPVGSSATMAVDLRVIAATNRDLNEMVSEGSFREDLYYRLNVVPVHLPPLRVRREDIPILADHFLQKYTESSGSAVEGFNLEAKMVLSNYSWPGNVRELENTVERMAVMHGDKELLDVEDIPREIQGDTGARWTSLNREPLPFQDASSGFERDYLTYLLKHTNGNVTEASRISGISRSHIHTRIKHFGLDPAKFRG